MKKSAFFTICLILSINTLSAQIKFGHVNTSEIIQSMPDYTKAQEDVNKLQEQYEADLKNMQEELQKKEIEYNKLPADTPDNIKQKKEKELLDMQERLNQTYQDSQQALQKAATEKMQAISNRVLDAVNQVGKEQGYIYIVDTKNKSILYYSTVLSTDVTVLVKTKLGLK